MSGCQHHALILHPALRFLNLIYFPLLEYPIDQKNEMVYPREGIGVKGCKFPNHNILPEYIEQNNASAEMSLG